MGFILIYVCPFRNIFLVHTKYKALSVFELVLFYHTVFLIYSNFILSQVKRTTQNVQESEVSHLAF